MENGYLTGHEPITDFIPIGKENAIHKADLATLAKMTESEAKSAIRAARKNTIILSGNDGYWLPNDPPTKADIEDIAAWLKMQGKQSTSRFETAHFAKKWLERFTDDLYQNSLELEKDNDDGE